MSLTNNKMDMLLTDDEFLTQVKTQQKKDQIFMAGVIGIMGTLASVCVYLTVL